MAQKTDQEKHPEKYFSGPGAHIKDRVMIHETAEIPREGQFVGLNGYQYLIKPGHEVDLPRPVLRMLDTRIRTETTQGEDGKNYTRDIHRVTYSIIKEGVNLPEPKLPEEAVVATAIVPAPSDPPEGQQAII